MKLASNNRSYGVKLYNSARRIGFFYTCLPNMDAYNQVFTNCFWR